MVRKMQAPGFIFVLTRVISVRRPWVTVPVFANLDRNLNKIV